MTNPQIFPLSTHILLLSYTTSQMLGQDLILLHTPCLPSPSTSVICLGLRHSCEIALLRSPVTKSIFLFYALCLLEPIGYSQLTMWLSFLYFTLLYSSFCVFFFGDFSMPTTISGMPPLPHPGYSSLSTVFFLQRGWPFSQLQYLLVLMVFSFELSFSEKTHLPNTLTSIYNLSEFVPPSLFFLPMKLKVAQ